MSWHVLEKSVLAANGQRGPEDVVIDGRSCDGRQFFFVGDSHSSFVAEKIGFHTPGQFVVHTLKRLICAVPVGDSITDLYAWVEELNSQIGTALKEVGRFDESPDTPHYRRPGIVFVAYFPHLRVVVRVGDCQYFLDGEGDNPGLKVDHNKTGARVRRIRAFLDDGVLNPTATYWRTVLLRPDDTQEEMKRLTLDWQHRFRNSVDPEWGYGVVDGTLIPRQHIEIIPVPDNIMNVVLTSDGIPPSLVRSSLSDTLAEFWQALRADPLCIGASMAGVRGAVVSEARVPEGIFCQHSGLWLCRYDDFAWLKVGEFFE